MRVRLPLALALLFTTATAIAQVQPQPAGSDPHLQQIDYEAGQVVQLRGTPGYQLMVELSPDERVQNVALGDSSAWQVSINREGNRLFLKPTQEGLVTNMTVVTSVRVYSFDLVASALSADVPYSVQFRYPRGAGAKDDMGYVDVSAINRRLSRYTVSGDRALWPTSVSDDGLRTYIAWPRSAAIPAVYASGRSGSDELLNGMMGVDDVYVVDGVPGRLTLRIDRSVAHLLKIAPRKKP